VVDVDNAVEGDPTGGRGVKSDTELKEEKKALKSAV
jgi:hypothetical protein